MAASAARYDRWRAGSTLVESADAALSQCVPGAQILLGDDAGHLERRLVVECDNKGTCLWCQKKVGQGSVFAHLTPCWRSSEADATGASRRPKSAQSTLTRVFDPSARPKIKEVRFVENPSVLDE